MEACYSLFHELTMKVSSSALHLSATRGRDRSFVLVCAALLLALSQTSQAEIIWGISVGSPGVKLFSVDSSAPGTFLSNTTITGVNSGFNLGGMDFRPSNGLLYALATNNANTQTRLYTINTSTAVATAVGGAQSRALDDYYGLAIDPVNDVMRVIEGDGKTANYRVNLTTGAFTTDTAVAFVSGDPGITLGQGLNIEGLAYTNPVAGASTLFGLSSVFGSPGADRLYRIGDVNGAPNSANTGQVHTIGSLNLAASPEPNTWEFDISPNTGTAYAWNGVFNLYSINLATGASTLLGTNTGIAPGATFAMAVAPVAAPEPGSLLLGALGGMALLGRRWRRSRSQ